jgi:hypothetical protein
LFLADAVTEITPEIALSFSIMLVSQPPHFMPVTVNVSDSIISISSLLIRAIIDFQVNNFQNIKNTYEDSLKCEYANRI